MGVMRIATEYDVGSVRSCVTRVPEASWPRAFSQWPHFQPEAQFMQEMHKEINDDRRINHLCLDDRLPEPASAIRLGHDFDVPSILLYAYYSLAQIPEIHDWNDIRNSSPEDLRNIYIRTAR